MTETDQHKFCIAPMMDWTDRHCRFFHRRISRHARLYTEMLTADALIHGDRERLLGFSDEERPLALQLGGAEPAKMAAGARIAKDWGYDEVNINVGCPSDRVQQGRFGACLMAEPETVARCAEAMRQAVRIPITVKCRIGIDDRDAYEDLKEFVDTVAGAGVDSFVVHARKAVLQGLNPKQNRTIPPLRYDYVHRLKAERPELKIILNGGLKAPAAALAGLADLDGLMFGREAYQNPYCLADVDALYFGDRQAPPSRHDVVRAMLPYIEQQRHRGQRLGAITRHMTGLFQGQPGARAWRRYLAENAYKSGAGSEVVLAAASFIPEPGQALAAS